MNNNSLMAGRGSGSKKKKSANAEVLSWRQKKAIADVEEAAVSRDVEELITWTNMAEAMDDGQLKEYLLNRAEALHGSTGNGESATGKKGQKSLKKRSTSTSSSSKGIMASIWKFHREDNEEASLTFQV
ncbi:hypothetical protein J5N97_012381 [Dioscorea zingiberensis]|uniref:Uncharacterized protein n=1 Tax=Dioscorea zingiberensis TaxID=325984 RepID=A0A9D5HI15_9LILI|nr:hypothetical protein J5N97_012381 [Dioscorea zingiberensis]